MAYFGPSPQTIESGSLDSLQNLADLSNVATARVNLDVPKSTTAFIGRETIPDAANLDDYMYSGVYYQTLNSYATNGTNYPLTSAGQLRVYNPSATGLGSTFIHQEYTDYATGQVYERFKFGTWLSWRKVYSQGNILGTVSQTTGIPTGAIIERGSNANGEYARFADGLLICTKRYEVSITANYNESVYAWTYPSAFLGSTIPVAFMNYEPASTQGYTISKAALSVGTTNSSLWFVNSSSQVFRFYLIAVGRWF